MPDREPGGRGRGAFRRATGLAARHRGATAVVGLALAGLLTFVVVWFEPQTLLLDRRVDEALPAQASRTASPGATATPRESGPLTLAQGRFESLEHETTGRALVLRTGSGLVLRFEDLATSNGPDLVVYLSTLPSGRGWRDYDDAPFLDLGELKGNIGDQNYALPANLDLSPYRSAVVWCRRFAVGFGVAPLVRA